MFKTIFGLGQKCCASIKVLGLYKRRMWLKPSGHPTSKINNKEKNEKLFIQMAITQCTSIFPVTPGGIIHSRFNQFRVRTIPSFEENIPQC